VTCRGRARADGRTSSAPASSGRPADRRGSAKFRSGPSGSTRKPKPLARLRLHAVLADAPLRLPPPPGRRPFGRDPGRTGGARRSFSATAARAARRVPQGGHARATVDRSPRRPDAGRGDRDAPARDARETLPGALDGDPARGARAPPRRLARAPARLDHAQRVRALPRAPDRSQRPLCREPRAAPAPRRLQQRRAALRVLAADEPRRRGDVQPRAPPPPADPLVRAPALAPRGRVALESGAPRPATLPALHGPAQPRRSHGPLGARRPGSPP
jgi:hypothetical protein